MSDASALLNTALPPEALDLLRVMEDTYAAAREGSRNADWRQDYTVRLSALLTNGLKPATPDAGPALSSGSRLLYHGEVNGVFGDSGTGKSLFAVAVCAAELLNGGHAAYVDTDGCGLPFVLRALRAFGVPDALMASAFFYRAPEAAQDLADTVDAIRANMPRGVVVVDSVDASVAMLGGSPNDSEAVRRFYAPLAYLATVGQCVITLDHIAKSAESRAYGASGSTAKKAAIGGAYLGMLPVKRFTRTTGGRASLVLYKDRQGGIQDQGVALGDTVADFVISAPDAQTGVQGVAFEAVGAASISAIPIEDVALAATGMHSAGVGKAWNAIRHHPDYLTWKAHGLTNRRLRAALSSRDAGDSSSLDQDEFGNDLAADDGR